MKSSYFQIAFSSFSSSNKINDIQTYIFLFPDWIKMNTTTNESTLQQDGVQRTDTFQIHRIAAPELLIIDRLITPIWYFIGIIGNTISAKIWLSQKMRQSNSSAIYLGSIAVVDLIFIFLHFWMELLQAYGISTFNQPVLCEVYNVLILCPQYLAPLLILGFTFERFIAICFPFLKENVCSVRKAFLAVNVLMAISILISLMQAYFWTYDEIGDACEIMEYKVNPSVPQLVCSSTRLHKTFINLTKIFYLYIFKLWNVDE